MGFKQETNDPIVGKMRKGTPDDPYKKIIETLQVINGTAQLTEVPNRFEKVVVTGLLHDMHEVNQGELSENTYRVDYTQGVVFFHAKVEAQFLVFRYVGRGAHFFPASRVYLTYDKDFQTAELKLRDIDRELLMQASRVDTLIRQNPQPSEVVDLRVDRNGKVFPVAKHRIDAEQFKIEQAYRDLTGKEHPSLKARIDQEQKKIDDATFGKNGESYYTLRERINGEQAKIEEAYFDKNNKRFSSLKNRIDAEQAKIEETYTGSDGKKYTSMRHRFDSVDDEINSLKLKNIGYAKEMENSNVIFEANDILRTLGFYSTGDGGNASYVVRDTNVEADGRLVISLRNGKQAHFIRDGEINVKQLGAKGDGVTDDTPAFQKALDFAKNGGVTVVVPKGQYKLTAELVVYENTKIKCNYDSVMLRYHTGYMVINGSRDIPAPSSYGGNGNIIFESGVWDARGVVSQTTGQASIMHFGHGHDITFDGVTLKDCYRSHHIEFNACKDVIVRDSKFIGYAGENFSGEAIQLDIAYPTINGKRAVTILPADSAPCKNVLIENCYFGSSSTPGSTRIPRGIGGHNAIIGMKHTNIHILHNKFEDILYIAIRGYHWEDVTIKDNHILNCGGGISIRPTDPSDPKDTYTAGGHQTNASEDIRNYTIEGNRIINGCDYTYPIISHGEETGKIRNILIANNHIIQDKTVNTRWAGIYFTHSADGSANGNKIDNTGGAGIVVTTGCINLVIAHNIISRPVTHGITCDSMCASLTIVGNSLNRIGRTGILLADIDKSTVSGNTIFGVNGNEEAGDSENTVTHIKLINSTNRITLSGNTASNYGNTYYSKTGMYITNTCSYISRSGNNFAGLIVNDNSTRGSNGADLV